MDIDKTLLVAAPPEKVWVLLLDPTVMGECVPGMQAIEVVSDTEYHARMQVKIAFVSAKFKIRTTIVEKREPHYLRTEGNGDDASVASSFKQASEMFLDEAEGGQTRLRIKVKVDMLGRLGAFGLNVMKTKADRLWDEFGVNLAARLAGGAAPAIVPAPAPVAEGAAASAAASAEAPTAAVVPPPRPLPPEPPRAGWFARLFGIGGARRGEAPLPQRQPTDICVQVRRGESTITVLWPAQNAAECAGWLREVLS